MKLRYYQQDAVKAFFAHYAQSKEPTIIAMPTGTGKSPVLARICEHVLTVRPHFRVMVLAHVQELIEQNYKTMRRIWPTAPTGIVSAGVGRYDTRAPIMFAGVQTISKRLSVLQAVDLIIVDECHLVSPKAESDYQKVFAHMTMLNPNLRILGLTATPYRLGQGLLIDNGLFKSVCYDITQTEEFNKLLNEGYLCKLIPRKTAMEINTDNLSLIAGEYDINQIDEQLQDKELGIILDEICEMGKDRKSWLIFSTSVKKAQGIADSLTQRGITAQALASKGVKKAERTRIINDFKNYKIKALIVVGMLTTGFDHPGLDLIAMVRATTSPGLWVQILGRGTRPDYAEGYDLETAEGRIDAIEASEKPNCLVLDYGGNTMRLGPINAPVVKMNRKKEGVVGKAPAKKCKDETINGEFLIGCGCPNHPKALKCIDCGKEFTFQKKINDKASNADLIVETFGDLLKYNVVEVKFTKHFSLNGNENLKADYKCEGGKIFKEYFIFEHQTPWIRKKAKSWWSYHSHQEAPETVDEALSRVDELNIPAAILIGKNKDGYDEIKRYLY